MNHRLREFLINSLRSGIIFEPKYKLKIYTPTFDQNIESYNIYQQAYDQALDEDIMTSDDAERWMRATGLWQKKDDESLEQTNKDIEDAKVQLYENRYNQQFKKHGKGLLRHLEYTLLQYSNKKNAFYNQTCESIAELERLTWILKQTCYIDNKPLDDNDNIDQIIGIYNKSILSDAQIRDLARNEPWRSLWIIGKNGRIKLFSLNDDQDITFNQRNLLLWSQTYDNIHESLECPSEEVIEDDDLLDGWFIIQKRKRTRDSKEKEFNESIKNEKIKSAQELFIIPREGQKHSSIYELNSRESAMKLQQRSTAIKKLKTVSYDQLPDVQNEARKQAMEGWKSHVKGRK